MTQGPEPVFDELVHAPIRLRVCGLLRKVDELEFGLIRDALDIDDAKLSKHLRPLLEAELLALRKERSPERADARRMTWVRLTPRGRAVLEAHLAALSRIADG